MHLPFAFLGTSSSIQLALPVFDPEGGSFPNGSFPMDVDISVQSPAIKFRYTINDNNIDLNNGILVNATSGTVSVPNHGILRAIAIDAQNRVSRVKLAGYDHEPGGNGGGLPPGRDPL